VCFDISALEDGHSMIHNIIISVCSVFTLCCAHMFDEWVECVVIQYIKCKVYGVP
jgi:hypothetical protein